MTCPNCGEEFHPGGCWEWIRLQRDLAIRDRDRLEDRADQAIRASHVAWARCRELEKEKDEAREVATKLVKHSVDCWSYQAELMEAYPWMRTSPPRT